MIFVDTHVVIAARTKTDPMHDQVARWIRSLGAEPLWLPAPVLLELAAAEKTSAHAEKVIVDLERRFRIRPFDAIAARLAGSALAHAGGVAAVAGSQQGRSARKQVLRTDAMILGCCLAARATNIDAYLYSSDTKMRALAVRTGHDGIVLDVPSIPEQGELALDE